MKYIRESAFCPCSMLYLKSKYVKRIGAIVYDLTNALTNTHRHNKKSSNIKCARTVSVITDALYVVGLINVVRVLIQSTRTQQPETSYVLCVCACGELYTLRVWYVLCVDDGLCAAFGMYAEKS